MTTDVNLHTPRHLDLTEIMSRLREFGHAEVSASDGWKAQGDLDTVHYRIGFKSAFDGNQPRELRVHTSVDRDGPYTWLAMGAHGGGPRIIEGLAEYFGGKYQNEADESLSRQFGLDAAPSPRL